MIMRKRLLVVASSTLLLCFSCLVSQAQNKIVPDDEKAPTYEIGGQIFSFSGHDVGNGWGAGVRFTYNLNNQIALDSDVNFFLPDEGPAYATQGLFGIKAGIRKKHVGVFAKVRPGFQTNFVVNDREQARFALDVGGVAEYYPNRHVVVRFDAGDVIIPFGNNVVGEGLFAERLGTTHNFQCSLGVSVRF
jgi:outer membrane protein with beta-barrel domain